MCLRPETTCLDLTSHLLWGLQGFWGSQAPVGTLGFGDVYALHHSESKTHIWEGLAGTSLRAAPARPPCRGPSWGRALGIGELQLHGPT